MPPPPKKKKKKIQDRLNFFRPLLRTSINYMYVPPKKTKTKTKTKTKKRQVLATGFKQGYFLNLFYLLPISLPKISFCLSLSSPTLPPSACLSLSYAHQRLTNQHAYNDFHSNKHYNAPFSYCIRRNNHKYTESPQTTFQTSGFLHSSSDYCYKQQLAHGQFQCVNRHDIQNTNWYLKQFLNKTKRP